MREGLSFANAALVGFGLRDKMRLIAAGKVLSAFHIARAMALGADTVNAARAMMLALGCIQSRSCNNDQCPTGIATQNPDRYMALDVTDKSERVARYQSAMVRHLVELMEAAGLHKVEELSPDLVMRRVDNETVKSFSELYPALKPGCLLAESSVPDVWLRDWAGANASHW
jgi:glutamate synthase domain-containing protein 2